jgi:hypothetical protein
MHSHSYERMDGWMDVCLMLMLVLVKGVHGKKKGGAALSIAMKRKQKRAVAAMTPAAATAAALSSAAALVKKAAAATSVLPLLPTSLAHVHADANAPIVALAKSGAKTKPKVGPLRPSTSTISITPSSSLSLSSSTSTTITRNDQSISSDNDDNDNKDDNDDQHVDNDNEDIDTSDVAEPISSTEFDEAASTATTTATATATARGSHKIVYAERIVPVALQEWLLTKLKITEVHELWNLFVRQWHGIPQSQHPNQTHRPQNLFNQLKVYSLLTQ